MSRLSSSLQNLSYLSALYQSIRHTLFSCLSPRDQDYEDIFQVANELTEVLSHGTCNLHGDIRNAGFVTFR